MSLYKIVEWIVRGGAERFFLKRSKYTNNMVGIACVTVPFDCYFLSHSCTIMSMMTYKYTHQYHVPI